MRPGLAEGLFTALQSGEPRFCPDHCLERARGGAVEGSERSDPRRQRAVRVK